MKPLLVYSRRCFRPSSLPAVGDVAAEPAAPPPASSPMPTVGDEVVEPVTPPPPPASSPVPAAATVVAPPPVSAPPVVPAASRVAFINMLARSAGCLLPVPAINKRRCKTVPPGDTPRRSRRLAGAKTEFGLNDLDRRTKKKAMRTLELIEEHEAIDQQALDDYAKLFKQPYLILMSRLWLLYSTGPFLKIWVRERMVSRCFKPPDVFTWSFNMIVTYGSFQNSDLAC